MAEAVRRYFRDAHRCQSSNSNQPPPQQIKAFSSSTHQTTSSPAHFSFQSKEPEQNQYQLNLPPKLLNKAGYTVGKKYTLLADASLTQSAHQKRRRNRVVLRQSAKKAREHKSEPCKPKRDHATENLKVQSTVSTCMDLVSTRDARDSFASSAINSVPASRDGPEESSQGRARGTENRLVRSGVSIPRRKRKFVYGNYDAYYGYRRVPEAIGGNPPSIDSRIGAMRAEWFHHRDCLDIGCNAGLVTASIARVYGCKTMQGVDIDPELVKRAERLVRSQGPPLPAHAAHGPLGADASIGAKTMPTPTLEAGSLVDVSYPISLPIRLGCSHIASSSQSCGAMGFPHGVSFRHLNFVQEPPIDDAPGTGRCVECFDTILCLSTSKWIHLCFGDDGLMRLFRRVYAALRPGGYFILEPQPWSSYKKNQRVSEETRSNFRSIRLRPSANGGAGIPDIFRDILIREIGFASCLDVPVSSCEKESRGFAKRPLLLFTKPLDSGSHEAKQGESEMQ